MLQIGLQALNRRQLVAGNLILFLVCLIAAQLGLWLAVADTPITVFWPPAGLALAAMFRYGKGLSIGAWFGAFTAGLMGLFQSVPSLTWPMAIGPSLIVATGALAGLLAGQELMTRIARGPAQQHVRQVALLMVAGLLGSAVSATAGTAALYFTVLAPGTHLIGAWLAWWVSCSLGVFLFTPLLLAWWGREEPRYAQRQRETVVCLTLLALTTYWAFLSMADRYQIGTAIGFIVLPFLTWAALRLGYRATTTGLVIFAFLAVLGLKQSTLPQSPDEQGLLLVILAARLLCLISTTLCIAAVVRERLDTERLLHNANQNLEVEVGRRTQSLKQLTEQLQNEVAQQKQTATALRESQERLELAVRAASIGYWDSDLIAKTVHYSPEWKAQLGYQPEELPSNFGIWRELLHPEDRAAALARVSDYLEGRATAYVTEFRLRHKDGSYRWIHSRGNLIKDSAGQPVRLIGCHLDITTRKRTEAKLEAFALLGKQLSAAATVREAARLIVGVAESLLGWDAAVLVMFDEKTGLCRPVLDVDLLNGQKADVCSPFHEKAPSPRMRRTIELGAELILRTEPVLETDAYRPFGDQTRPSASMMFVPVRDSERTVAMLSIQSYQRNAYTPADLDTLQALADHGGGALARIRSREIQKEAERALRESSERLHLALEVARMGTWDLDLGTDFVHADPRLVKMFGGPNVPQLTRNADFNQFIHPADRPQLRAAIERAMAGSDFFHERFRVVWPDDSIHWLEGQGKVFRNPEGQPLRMVGVTVDVTERHQAEEALRLSEQEYAELVNNIDGIVWEADVRTLRMTFVSHQAKRILGYPPSDWTMNATFWQDHIHPDDRDAAMGYCAARTARGEDHSFEYRMLAADGSEVWLEDFVTVQMDQGKPVTLRGVMVDITRRKNLEQEQARAFSLLQTTIESSEDGLLVVDRDGRVRVHNQRFVELWRLPAGLVTSMDDQALLDFAINQLTAPDDFLAKVKHLYAEPEEESFDVLQFKDGRIFERYSRPQRLGPEIIGRVWSFRDMTERRSNERLMQGQSKILASIASGVPLTQALTELCVTAETASPGMFCSVLLVAEDGRHLRHGAAPNLPESFCRAIDGIAIGPVAGSCGTAVHREATVIVEDIATDPLWADIKLLALPLGLRACWSTPIFDASRAVLGTLAFYYPTPKRPTTRERRIIEMATHTAAIAILKHRSDEELTRSAKILRQLSANLLETQEAERHHLARELHDELGQTLTATKIALEGLRHDDFNAISSNIILPALPLANHPSLANAISHVELMLTQVRNLSLSLRPPMLDDFGLPAALRWLADQHTKTTGRPVTCDLTEYHGRPEPMLETACFRIAQEALTNISRHSGAQNVNVVLQSDAENFTLVVRDDGVGFDFSAAAARAHEGNSLGLLGQQERAALVGGKVEIISRPGAGTEVRAQFPLGTNPNLS